MKSIALSKHVIPIFIDFFLKIENLKVSYPDEIVLPDILGI